jgi:membrane peptidoglycan carboxypeptidase
VVSTQTATDMTAMLGDVVKVGTGKAGAIAGYDVAGKTGTARKPNPNGSGYLNGAYMSSFAGFVPMEQPSLTAMVVLDQPTPIFGGQVSAPVFAQMAAYSLRQLRVPPPAPGDHLVTSAPAATAATARGVGDVGDTSASSTVATPARTPVAPSPSPSTSAPAATAGRTPVAKVPPATAAGSTPATTAPRRRSGSATTSTLAGRSRPVP